jgi:hypothetical protein
MKYYTILVRNFYVSFLLNNFSLIFVSTIQILFRTFGLFKFIKKHISNYEIILLFDNLSILGAFIGLNEYGILLLTIEEVKDNMFNREFINDPETKDHYDRPCDILTVLIILFAFVMNFIKLCFITNNINHGNYLFLIYDRIFYYVSILAKSIQN